MRYDVVVGEGAAIFELLARKDEAPLVLRNALLVLDLGLDVLNRVRGLDPSQARCLLYKLTRAIIITMLIKHVCNTDYTCATRHI